MSYLTLKGDSGKRTALQKLFTRHLCGDQDYRYLAVLEDGEDRGVSGLLSLLQVLLSFLVSE